MDETPEEKLRGRLGESCEGEIAHKVAEFGGLLSRNAAVALLCKMNGIDLEKRVPLAEARKMNLPFSFQAKIDRIFPVHVYPGSHNKSVRMHVSDGASQGTIILWNEQAKAVEGEISTGDIIECKGAYYKGGEVGIGKGGSIKKEKGFPITPLGKLPYGLCNVEGEVKAVEPDHFYEDRNSGVKKRLLSFTLCEGDACRRVVMWPPQSDGKKVSAGDVLLLENVFFRNNELHVDAYSRLVRKKTAGERFGKFVKAEVEGGTAFFQIDSEKYGAGLEEALALLRIRAVPPGVGAGTLITIKSREMEGKAVKYFVEGGKLTLLEVE